MPFHLALASSSSLSLHLRSAMQYIQTHSQDLCWLSQSYQVALLKHKTLGNNNLLLQSPFTRRVTVRWQKIFLFYFLPQYHNTNPQRLLFILNHLLSSLHPIFRTLYNPFNTIPSCAYAIQPRTLHIRSTVNHLHCEALCYLPTYPVPALQETQAKLQADAQQCGHCPFPLQGSQSGKLEHRPLICLVLDSRITLQNRWHQQKVHQSAKDAL